MTRARRLAVARIGLLTFAVLATAAMAVAIGSAGRGCARCAEPKGERPRLTDRAERPGPELAPGDTLSPPSSAAPSGPPAGLPGSADTPHTDSGGQEPAPNEPTPPHTGPGAEEVLDDPTPPHTDPGAEEAPPGEQTSPGHEPTPAGDDSEETAPDLAPDTQPAPVAASPLDVNGAADYVRAFYADLSQRHFRAAWPRLAADLRARHGSFDAWKRGFATTLRQSAAEVSATAIGSASAKVSLTLTAVDRHRCNREVTRRFAVTWRLDRGHGNEWRAVHAEAKALKSSPSALIASC